MALLDEVNEAVDQIIAARWETRDGQIVPESEDVRFLGDAVKLEATFLYADLGKSSTLATAVKKHLASEIFQAYLNTASRVIRAKDGAIRSFDGDRVLAVFIGDSKNTRATDCGLKLNYVVQKVLQPKFANAYEAIKNGSYSFLHGVGIDAGEVWAIRGGVRNNSDLLFVGTPANIAAKLSAIREGDGVNYCFITDRVFNGMNDSSKYAQSGDRKGEIMWAQRTWSGLPGQQLYRSSWYRPI